MLSDTVLTPVYPWLGVGGRQRIVRRGWAMRETGREAPESAQAQYLRYRKAEAPKYRVWQTTCGGLSPLATYRRLLYDDEMVQGFVSRLVRSAGKAAVEKTRSVGAGTPHCVLPRRKGSTTLGVAKT